MSGHFQSADLPSQLLLLTTLRLLTLAPGQNFTNARSGPVRVLSEVLERYLGLVAQTTQEAAHLAGREQASLADAVEALQRLGYSHGQMMSWAKDAATGNPQDDEQRDMAQLAALLEPAKAKKPSRRKQLSYRQASDAEQSSMIKQTMAIYNELSEDDGTYSTPAQDAKAQESSPSLAAEASGWRRPEDVPAHIPPFFPPLPGLERPFMALAPQPTALAPTPANAEASQSATADDTSNDKEEAPRATNAGALNMAIGAGADLASHQYKHGHVDPWKHVVPFDRSHLLLREPQLLPANLPLPLKSSDLSPEEDQRPLSSLMSYFKLHKRLATDPPLQPTWSSRSKRRQAAALLQRPDAANSDRFDLSDLNSSIGGLVGAQRPRFTRKTPGWLPYSLNRPKDPKDRKGQQPNPVLHAYDLQSDVLDNISEPLVAPAQHDLSAQLASLVGGSNARRVAGQDIGLPPGVKGFIRRTTRIAQPGPLGGSGETLPYVIEDADPTTGDHSKRLLYGFDWKEQDFATLLSADQQPGQGPEAGPSGTSGNQPAHEGQGQEAGQTQVNGPTSQETQSQTNRAAAPTDGIATPSLKVTLNGTQRSVQPNGNGHQNPQVNGSASSAPADVPASSAMELELVPIDTTDQPDAKESRQSAPPVSQSNGGESEYDWVNGSQLQPRASAPPAASEEKTSGHGHEPSNSAAPSADGDIEMLPVIGSSEALSTEAAPTASAPPDVPAETAFDSAASTPAPVQTTSPPKRLSIKIGSRPQPPASSLSTTSPPPVNHHEEHTNHVQQQHQLASNSTAESQTDRVLTPTASQPPTPSQEVKPTLKFSLKLGGPKPPQHHSPPPPPAFSAPQDRQDSYKTEYS